MEYDLKKIKKHYGEDMAHFCRRYFPTLLEEKGLLFGILEKYFAFHFHLYQDIKASSQELSFVHFVQNKSKLFQEESELFSMDSCNSKTPKELLEEAGYDFYECHTESEIQSFRKYFTKEEELCTFRGGRLKSRYVFFAVSKNVDQIMRGSIPNRQDAYGTSVISIQFSKTNPSILSIKNRYNHTVVNPDATFSNNLDAIIPGLRYSFEQTYSLSIKSFDSSFELPNYVIGSDKKYYKYNYEINSVYYCVNNTIIDREKIIHLDPLKYLLFDYFILDLQRDKRIFLYDESISDSMSSFSLKNVFVTKNKRNKYITMYFKNNPVPALLTLDSQNRMRELTFNSFSKIENNFCIFVNYLEKLDIDWVVEIGDRFFEHNQTIEILKSSRLKKVGKYFLKKNNSLIEFKANYLQVIGAYFLMYNGILNHLEIEKIQSIGSYSFYSNSFLQEISWNFLEELGENVLASNERLHTVSCNYCISGGKGFLRDNFQHDIVRLKKKISYYQLKKNLEVSKKSFPLQKTKKY